MQITQRTHNVLKWNWYFYLFNEHLAFWNFGTFVKIVIVAERLITSGHSPRQVEDGNTAILFLEGNDLNILPPNQWKEFLKSNLLLDDISWWHWAVNKLQLAVWQASALWWSRAVLAVSMSFSTPTLSSHQEVDGFVGNKCPSWNRNSANMTVLPDAGSTNTLFNQKKQALKVNNWRKAVTFFYGWVGRRSCSWIWHPSRCFSLRKTVWKLGDCQC